MKKYFMNGFKMSAVLLACSASIALAAPQMNHCPQLTANDVESIIDTGTISTEQGYTLADEAGVTRAEVLTNEPTANPFDTYYEMSGKKVIDNQEYFIYVGNVLGKAPYEAKARAKQILLSGEKIFNAEMDTQNKVCIYEAIDASPSIANYPFKSHYESTVLFAVPFGERASIMNQQKMKKHLG